MEKQLPTFGEIQINNNYSIAIVGTLWNKEMTDQLTDDAERIISSYSNLSTTVYKVAGTIELTHAASVLSDKYDAVIVFGVVIRGETPHFDYVCDSVTQGITTLNTQGKTPVIFGVLTVDSELQAERRIKGPEERKGEDAAYSAIAQLSFIENI